MREPLGAAETILRVNSTFASCIDFRSRVSIEPARCIITSASFSIPLSSRSEKSVTISPRRPQSLRTRGVASTLRMTSRPSLPVAPVIYIVIPSLPLGILPLYLGHLLVDALLGLEPLQRVLLHVHEYHAAGK